MTSEKKGFVWYSSTPTTPICPSDSFEEMVIRVQKRGLNFPYLKDQSGAVARSFGAVCTPHGFVLDENRRLR